MASVSTLLQTPLVAGATETRSETRWQPVSVARGLLVANLIAAPLTFGAVQTWAWAAMTVLAVVALLAWGVGEVRLGFARISWSPLCLPGVLFLLVGVVQFSGHRSFDPHATRESLLKLGTELVFFFLGCQVYATGSDKALKTLGLTITVFAFSLSLFALLQFFSNPRLIYWAIRPRWESWVFGPYVNHNHYAGLMEMLIPVAAAYVLSRPRAHTMRPLLGFALLISVASLLLSGSRAGFICLGAEIVMLGAILLRFGGARRGQHMATLLALGSIVALLLFFWMDSGDTWRRLAGVANSARWSDADFGSRKLLTLDSLRILSDHWWLGTGLGSFAVVYPGYQSFPSDQVWDHAHNDYVEALVETGLVGGTLILTSLVTFVCLAFRNLKDRLRDEQGWIRLGATLGVSGMLFHSLVDFNLHIPANAAWFAVCAAVAQHQPVSSGSGPPKDAVGTAAVIQRTSHKLNLHRNKRNR